MEILNYLLDIIKSLGIIIASGVAIWGINSWRREAKWKRKYELAEEVLANFYEAFQAIRLIRSPFGYSNEGKSRPKHEDETEENSRIYDSAYVVRERYSRNKESLEKLQTLKYRFITLYGKDYEVHFEKFDQTVNRVFNASDELARLRFDSLSNKNLNQNLGLKDVKEELRKILYTRLDEKDEIEKELKAAIEAIELKCREIIGKI
ncbi:MAG: hypothetical protein Kapaf2KO_07380 [Candidatus Kapaibacteriales bacterium]